MANYNAFIRTNYFTVTDEQRFRDLMAKCSCSEGAVELFEGSCANQFGFGCHGSLSGIPYHDGEDDDNDIEYSMDDFLAGLQALLPDGEAIILTEVGYEKLRYLIGIATVITNEKIASVELEAESFKLAAQLLDVDNFSTTNNY